MDRIRCDLLKNKIVSADDAAKFIKDDMFIGMSGFTFAGYPKAVPMALRKKVDNGEKIQIDLMTGASVGFEIDELLSEKGIIRRRYPYQTNSVMRNLINNNIIQYNNIHLSHSTQYLKNGFLGKMDIAIIEAIAITEDGGIIPSTSLGNSPAFVEYSEKVIVEINLSQPLELEGLHDIYITKKPPNCDVIPIKNVNDRIGTVYIPCSLEKIIAIVITDIEDKTNDVKPIDDVYKKIAKNLIGFLESEVEKQRLPKNLLPLQSGVGSVANAVLGGLKNSNFTNLNIYSEVLQDSILDLIDNKQVVSASATSLTISPNRLKDFYRNISKYKNHIILRPQDISNSSEVIRRLGVISINTAIELDIYGNVNSTHIIGSKMMNGIGGSGDFTRNAYISIFTTCSTAKEGKISSIVPMVSHVDHTEHDVMVIITEEGVADLRGLSPRERANLIINNCAHPDYKEKLQKYLIHSEKHTNNNHIPLDFKEAYLWYEELIETGSML